MSSTTSSAVSSAINSAINGAASSFLKSLKRECIFIGRDRAIGLWVTLVIILSSVSVGFGLAEVKRQHATINHLIEANQQERLAESPRFKNWGSAAYYGFHFTYQSPSSLAFAAFGQRDNQPWKHRIRMLALEGQIYERDVGNPSVAVIGRFDFAFLAAFIFPLILIMLLYDVRASEKIAGRFHLLEATAGQARSLWLSRTFLRTAIMFLCLMAPMVVAGLWAGASTKSLLWLSLAVLLFTSFWAWLCYVVSAWQKSSAVILMVLIGIWLATAVVIPASARLIIDRIVPIPSGADILMTQRETVNDAWDLPREATMSVFFERHPEWSNYQPVEASFEWPWYYAFQQVGDQKAEALSVVYREGKLQRDAMAGWVSFFAPSSLLERTLQSLAKTDMRASMAYEQAVRDYHEDLRAFYYPHFFSYTLFDKAILKDLPEFNAQ